MFEKKVFFVKSEGPLDGKLFRQLSNKYKIDRFEMVTNPTDMFTDLIKTHLSHVANDALRFKAAKFCTENIHHGNTQLQVQG